MFLVESKFIDADDSTKSEKASYFFQFLIFTSTNYISTRQQSGN
jgi:hypothetical protein